MSFDNDNYFSIYYGCVSTESKKLLNQKQNGILGLSDINKINYNITSFTISLCKDGGYFDVNNKFNEYDKTNIDMILDSNYKIILNKFKLNTLEFNIPVNSSIAIIDTGSTLCHFPVDVYRELLNLFSYYCKEITKCLGTYEIINNTKCFSIFPAYSIKEFISSFPTLDLIFQNLVINWYPNEYLIVRDNLVCFGFIESTNFVLGQSFLINKKLEFFPLVSKLNMKQEAKCKSQNQEIVRIDRRHSLSNRRIFIIKQFLQKIILSVTLISVVLLFLYLLKYQIFLKKEKNN